ncbi:MAG TPA: hypothetical protein VGC63_02440 [Solirubrobacterales bacterium]|jgi:hypothetical protein
MALQRTIAPGCATLLEPTDDRDNSAADFSVALPRPRANSMPPIEQVCSPNAGGPGGAGSAGNPSGRGAPQTSLKRKPPRRGRDRTPTFAFAADEAGATFQCKLGSKAFKACHSPFTTARLLPGRHTFKVRARDDSGRLDPSPATYSFKVTARRG